MSEPVPPVNVTVSSDAVPMARSAPAAIMPAAPAGGSTISTPLLPSKEGVQLLTLVDPRHYNGSGGMVVARLVDHRQNSIVAIGRGGEIEIVGALRAEAFRPITSVGGTSPKPRPQCP